MNRWKPYPEYRDSGVEWLGEIPGHWELERLKFVSTFVTSGSRGWAEHYSDEGAIHFRWLAYCLLSDVDQKQFAQSFYGGTRVGLGLDDVRNVVVVTPPMKEQRAIAAFLDRETSKIDALVVKVREAINKLKEYRTVLISAAVTGKIDVSGGATATSWRWCRR